MSNVEIVTVLRREIKPMKFERFLDIVFETMCVAQSCHPSRRNGGRTHTTDVCSISRLSVQEGPAPTVLCRPVMVTPYAGPYLDRTLAIADIIAGGIGVESPRVRVLRRGDSASESTPRSR
jgi:hypothetical protein